MEWLLCNNCIIILFAAKIYQFCTCVFLGYIILMDKFYTYKFYAKYNSLLYIDLFVLCSLNASKVLIKTKIRTRYLYIYILHHFCLFKNLAWMNLFLYCNCILLPFFNFRVEVCTHCVIENMALKFKFSKLNWVMIYNKY